MPNVSVEQWWLIVGTLTVFVLTVVLVRALVLANANGARGRAQTRPSAEEILKSVHGTIKESLRDRGFCDIEAEEKAVDVGIFLEKTFLRFKNPWEGLETAVIEALIGESNGFDKKCVWEGFNVLRFETTFMNHEAEGDLYELSEEFEGALEEFTRRQSVSLGLLPPVSLEAKSEGIC